MFRSACVVIAVLAGLASASQLFTERLDEHWEAFKAHHAKNYAPEEERMRRLVWEDNMKFVRDHNLEYDLGKHTYFLGMNKYSDLTHDEMVATLNGYKPNGKVDNNAEYFMPPLNYEPPNSVDWRQKGYVTKVKDQGSCGSCWAFSTTGTLEGQWKRKHGKLPSLSEQQLVDCDRSDDGCDGGLPVSALKYIASAGGIDGESSYRYTGRDGSCKFKKGSVVARDSGSVKIQHGSEQALAKAVASVGPISIGIDASSRSFGHYKGGIYNNPSCGSSMSQLDHAVLVAGYGDGYWLVKNSWGTSWGDHGYIKMSKDKHNQCGVATDALYPKV